MKKLIAGSGLLLVLLLPARATVSCSVPFNLTNGTLADASQVMANYNAILMCLSTGAAASGVNNDITALLALTTPLTPAQGGNFLTYAGSGSNGTAGNAILVPTVTPSNYALPGTVGQKLTWVSDGANTGATTLNAKGTGVENFYRPTPSGPQPMVGGEITAGQTVEATWDGTEYQMTSQPALSHAPGEVFDVAGSTCPTGSLETNGSSLISQTTYPTLYADLGTTWGVAAGGNFTIPDLRGRTTFSRDSGGSGRITAAGGNFAGTVVGNTGGYQSNVVSQQNLTSFTVPNTLTPAANYCVSGVNCSSGTTAFVISGPVAGSGQPAGLAITGSVTSGGSSTPLPTLSNAAITIKCIKG